jgi:hypothetical protein
LIVHAMISRASVKVLAARLSTIIPVKILNGRAPEVSATIHSRRPALPGFMPVQFLHGVTVKRPSGVA